MQNQNYDQILKTMKASAIIPQVITRIFLYGPPGTGKSTIATTLFGRENIERVSLSKKTPIEDLLGMMSLAKDGSLVWIDGPAAKALRHGKCLVLDEMGSESEALRCTLHALLDNPAGVTLPNGERVEAAPGYCVIATSNQSPGQIADALVDRFELILPAMVPSEGLRDQLSDKGKSILDNVAARIEADTRDSFNWRRPMTPRLLLAIESLMRRNIALEDIARFLFAGDPAKQADLLALYA